MVERSAACEATTGFTTTTTRMEGHGYEHFGPASEEDTYQVDYRRIVGDLEPPRANPSPQEGEGYVRQSSISHGHETAAQRYSATRIQVGLGPVR